MATSDTTPTPASTAVDADTEQWVWVEYVPVKDRLRSFVGLHTDADVQQLRSKAFKAATVIGLSAISLPAGIALGTYYLGDAALNAEVPEGQGYWVRAE